MQPQSILRPGEPVLETQFLEELADGARQKYMITYPVALEPEGIVTYTGWLLENVFLPALAEAGYVEAEVERPRYDFDMVADDEGQVDPCCVIITIAMRASKKRAVVRTGPTLQ